MRAAGVPGLWQFPSADGRVVTLFRTERSAVNFWRLAAHEGLATGVNVELLPPDATAEAERFPARPAAGARQPGWQLALAWNDEKLVNATTHGKIAAYVLTGLLAITVALALALWIALTRRPDQEARAGLQAGRPLALRGPSLVVFGLTSRTYCGRL